MLGDPEVRILEGDCLERMEELPGGSVDLIITSPPYADQRKGQYGGISLDEYVTWFRPRAAEMLRLLKPTGSFVLNIKERVHECERSTYVLELILDMRRNGWLWIEEYIWCKKNPMPGKWKLRFKDGWERLLHFAPTKDIKMNQDAVRQPTKDESVKRYAKAAEQEGGRMESKTGSKFGVDHSKMGRIEKSTGSGFGFDYQRYYSNPPPTSLPSNVLEAACINPQRVKDFKHPAAFPTALPEFFIKLFTDKDDVVLDPFVGSGTTLEVAQNLGRQGIGIEMKPEYATLLREKFNA